MTRHLFPGSTEPAEWPSRAPLSESAARPLLFHACLRLIVGGLFKDHLRQMLRVAVSVLKPFKLARLETAGQIQAILRHFVRRALQRIVKLWLVKDWA